MKIPNATLDEEKHVCGDRRCCANAEGFCPHCGDVREEPRCPHDTPKQDNNGLDI